MRFAEELLQRATLDRGGQVARAPIAAKAGFFESVRAFWSRQPGLATAIVAIVIVAGVALLVRPLFSGTSGSYASIRLNLSAADRATGAETQTVELPPGSRGLRIELNLPGQTPQAKNYRVELLDPQQSSRNLTIAERKAQSLIVTIPANELTRGSYIIRVYAVNADGTEQRIRGNYFFNVG